jgi:hypothetical protein
VAVEAYGPERSRVGLVAAPGHNDITGWASLKGKKVAFQQSTVLEAVLLQGRDSAGLSLSDIEPVKIAAPDIPQAFDNGSFPAASSRSLFSRSMWPTIRGRSCWQRAMTSPTGRRSSSQRSRR